MYTLHHTAHLPDVETGMSSDWLPLLITSSSLRTVHTGRADFLSVWNIACLCRRRDMSVDWQGCSLEASIYSSIKSKICTKKRKNALLNTVTFKLLADFLLMSFSCPLPYILLLCRLAMIQTPNPPRFPMIKCNNTDNQASPQQTHNFPKGRLIWYEWICG